MSIKDIITYFVRTSTAELLRCASIALGLIAIAALFVEMWQSSHTDILTAICQHDVATVVGRFYAFVTIFTLGVVLALAGLLFGIVTSMADALQSGQGYVIVLVVLGVGSTVSLFIYGLKLGGDHQESFGLAGTGGLAFLFGFLQGFNLKRGSGK